MIVKKRKKKGNRRSKGLKKLRGPNITSLQSLQLNHILNGGDGKDKGIGKGKDRRKYSVNHNRKGGEIQKTFKISCIHK